MHTANYSLSKMFDCSEDELQGFFRDKNSTSKRHLHMRTNKTLFDPDQTTHVQMFNSFKI